mgnify:CR=1 FL=1
MLRAKWFDSHVADSLFVGCNLVPTGPFKQLAPGGTCQCSLNDLNCAKLSQAPPNNPYFRQYAFQVKQGERTVMLPVHAFSVPVILFICFFFPFAE